MATNWEDKFATLKSTTFKTADNKEWKFALEESKTKGTLQINARCWTTARTEGAYSGPSKNGFILPVKSVDDLEKIKECFQTFVNFIEETKEFI